jgi:hypothetical protein
MAIQVVKTVMAMLSYKPRILCHAKRGYGIMQIAGTLSYKTRTLLENAAIAPVGVYSMKKIYSRWQAGVAVEALKDRRIVIISGARQCGKTTMAKQIAASPNKLKIANHSPASFCTPEKTRFPWGRMSMPCRSQHFGMGTG